MTAEQPDKAPAADTAVRSDESLHTDFEWWMITHLGRETMSPYDMGVMAYRAGFRACEKALATVPTSQPEAGGHWLAAAMIEAREYGPENHQVWLKIGNQEFRIGDPWDNAVEAKWGVEMLSKALCSLIGHPLPAAPNQTKTEKASS